MTFDEGGKSHGVIIHSVLVHTYVDFPNFAPHYLWSRYHTSLFLAYFPNDVSFYGYRQTRASH